MINVTTEINYHIAKKFGEIKEGEIFVRSLKAYTGVYIKVAGDLRAQNAVSLFGEGVNKLSLVTYIIDDDETVIIPKEFSVFITEKCTQRTTELFKDADGVYDYRVRNSDISEYCNFSELESSDIFEDPDGNISVKINMTHGYNTIFLGKNKICNNDRAKESLLCITKSRSCVRKINDTDIMVIIEV